jgi:myo-inositol-1(or 4)-monophosphatase
MPTMISSYIYRMSMEQLCRQTCDLVRTVGAFIEKESAEFSTDKVETKSFNQLVSYVDKTAEEMLVKGLHELHPEAGFITEEQTIATEKKEFMWVIDPLDGTTNFVHAVPVYSISIGLIKNNKPVLGVVFEINRKEMFYAWENSPAYLNEKVIQVSPTTKLADSLLATGFPYYDFEVMMHYLETLHILMKTSHGMRRMGSAAVDLAYVACGRFDGFFEYGLSPWDVAGGAFIVQQAGGKVTDFSGDNNFIFGKEIIASSQGIYKHFQEVIADKFGKKK